MTVAALQHYLEQCAQPDARLAIVDLDGVLRGKIVSRDKLIGILEQGMGFCDVVFGWDSADDSYDNSRLTGWHTGFPDAQAYIDPATLRELPWEGGRPCLLADFYESASAVAAACPRSLLRRVAQRAQDQGYSTRFAQEFEWFNFRETPQSWADKDYRHPEPITPGKFGYSILRLSQGRNYVNDLLRQLPAFGIPIEGLHTETGPGVYEAAMHASSVVEAADRATLFKTAVREIALQHGIMASFMAKWSADLPGCGGHLHQSLWSADGSTNVFHAESGGRGMSQEFDSYLAGQLEVLPMLMPLLAPNVNSYKRLVSGAWAPTTVSWGFDNRTVAWRVIGGSAQQTRLETRIPGADTNPYLVMAACLAAGLYGLERALPLRLEPSRGSGYQDSSSQRLARNLDEATTLLDESAVARELLGADFVDHLVRTRRWEWQQYQQAVTDWELKRYFEIS